MAADHEYVHDVNTGFCSRCDAAREAHVKTAPMAADAPMLTKTGAKYLVDGMENRGIWDGDPTLQALRAIASGQTVNIDRALWEQVVGALRDTTTRVMCSCDSCRGARDSAVNALAAAEKVRLP